MSHAAHKPKTFTINGTVGVMGSIENLDGTHCAGAGEYADLVDDAQVTISDASGKALAVGSLNPGKLLTAGPYRGCRFDFMIRDVPGGRKFYGVQVGDQSAKRYSSAAARQGVHLTFGDQSGGVS